MEATKKPKGYAKIPLRPRRVIADVSNFIAALAVILGVAVPPQIPVLWLRIPALVAAGGLAIGCWFVHRRIADKTSVPVRGGVSLAAAFAALLAMTFHKAGGYTSLAGLLCFISVLTARGSLDVEKPHTPPDWRRTGWSTLRDNIESLAGSLIIVLIVWHFCLEAFKIPTGSMLPTLYGDNVWGDRVLVDKFCYEFSDPARWEPVVFRYPLRRTDPYVKRCIGLPGEQVMIAQGDIYVRRTPTSEVELLQKTGEARDVLWYPVIGQVTKRIDFLKYFVAEGKADFADGRITFGKEGETGAVIFPKEDSKPGNVRDHDPSGQGQASEEIGYNRRVVGDLRLHAKLALSKVVDDQVEFVIVRDDDEYALRLDAAKPEWAFFHRQRNGQGSFTTWTPIESPSLKSVPVQEFSQTEIKFGLADGMLRAEFATAQLFSLLKSSVGAEVQVGGTLLNALAKRDNELKRAGKPPINLSSSDALTAGMSEPPLGRRGQVRIACLKQRYASVEVLGIDRDVYYVGRVIEQADGVKELPFAVTLKDDQYFVLGDNSPGSKDTRFWVELIIEQSDGTAVRGGLDDQGQYVANLLHRGAAGETLQYRDERGKERPISALMSMQRMARFSHAERGLDQPADQAIADKALSVLKQEAQKERLERIPFITTGGHDVQVNVGSIRSLRVRLVPYVERDLFVGRPFAVFLWPNRMKLID